MEQAMERSAADVRWRAVLARDATLAGPFIVAVKTTGIYCRPGCPARTPKLENVESFASSEEERAARYRACKRCKPDDAAWAQT